MTAPTTLTGSAPELGIERITASLIDGAACFDRKAGNLTLFFASPIPSIVQDQPPQKFDAGECEWLEQAEKSVLLSRNLHTADYEGFWVHVVGDDGAIDGTLRITRGDERADEDDKSRSPALERARWLAVARWAWLTCEWTRETEAAVSALEQAAERLPKCGWIQLQCGRALSEQAGEHKRAAVHLDRAESLGITTAADRSRVLLALGRTDDALALADVALASGADLRAQWVRAAALTLLDRIPDATEALQACLSIPVVGTDHPLTAYRNSAHRVLGQLAHNSRAVACALVTSELGNDAVDGLRAWFIERVGDDLASSHFERIERLWTQVAERPPCKSSADFSKCLHAVADALQSLAQHVAAVAVYRGIADAPGAIGEGKSLEALGRREEAKAAFEKADAAGHRDAKMFLSRFQALPRMDRAQRQASIVDDAVDIGDVVMHKKYGRGVVVDVEDGAQTKIMVEFDGGQERTLLPKFVSVVERAT